MPVFSHPKACRQFSLTLTALICVLALTPLMAHAGDKSGWLPGLPGWMGGGKKSSAEIATPIAETEPSVSKPDNQPAFLPPATSSQSVDAAEAQFLAPDAPKKLPAPAPMTSIKLTQPALGIPDIADPVASTQNPPVKQMLIDDPKNPYGLTYARNQMSRCTAHVSAGRWPEAQVCLNPVKDWLIQATEAHINLNKSLTKVRTARAQAELEKQLALNFAVLRDEAFYQQAKIMVAQNRPKEAIKLLVGVVESQPRNQLGVKSYELLQSIGFTERLQLVEAPEEDAPANEMGAEVMSPEN